jgi:hypothetical protein
LAAVFDPLTGMCGGFYIPCIGVIGTRLLADPTSGIVGGFAYVILYADWSDGTVTDETWHGGFGSSDRSVIGAGSGGLVSFLSPGLVCSPFLVQS